MTSDQAVQWLSIDSGVPGPDSPASMKEALQRALHLDDGEVGCMDLLSTVLDAVLSVEKSVPHAVGRAFVFGARLARHAADVERIGDVS